MTNDWSLYIHHDTKVGFLVPPIHPDDDEYDANLATEPATLSGKNCGAEPVEEDYDIDLRTAKNLVCTDSGSPWAHPIPV